MFKLAAFTDEISQDFAHACDVCVEFGVQGLEIRGVWECGVHKLTDGQVRDAKQIAADRGLVVCSIGSPFGKCEVDKPDEIAEHMDILRRCADVALELECGLVRGFAFWGHGRREKPWDAMLKAYELVPGILEEKGVLLGLENEAACYVGTAGHTRTFLDMLQCPRIKAVWDPANHVQDGDFEIEPVYPEAYLAIRNDMVHVHVKDAIVTPEGRPNVFLGMGLCQWEDQFRAFRRDGYEGYVSLETHVNPERFPETLRERYGRYLTGAGREGASKVCLAWMRDALAAEAGKLDP